MLANKLIIMAPSLTSYKEVLWLSCCLLHFALTLAATCFLVNNENDYTSDGLVTHRVNHMVSSPPQQSGTRKEATALAATQVHLARSKF